MRAAQKQSRNKILQFGKTPEKNQGHWCRGGQVIGCDTRYGITDKPMQRFSISLMSVLLGISLVTAAVEQSDANVADAKVANAKVVITRSERCSNLSRQFDEALETHATATQVTAAKALQRKGNRFCANRKQAQGIRMLANALKLLGVTPIDPVQ